MKENNSRHGIIRKRHRVNIPLHALKTSEAVKVLSDSPRRLGELWELFQNRDRTIRQRAAAALARLASIQPAPLRRSEQRIADLLQDDSAYVRWHAVYAVGRLIAGDRARVKRWVPDLAAALEDHNGIVRAMAARVLTRAAVQDRRALCEAFQGMGLEIPSVLAEALKQNGKEILQSAMNKGEEESA